MKRILATTMMLMAVASLAAAQTNIRQQLTKSIEIRADSSRTGYDAKGHPVTVYEGKVEVHMFRSTLQADKVTVSQDPKETRRYLFEAEGNITLTRAIYITENGNTFKLRDVVDVYKAPRLWMRAGDSIDEQ